MATQEKITLAIDAQNNTTAAINSVNNSLGSLRDKIDSITPALQKVGVGAGIVFAGVGAVAMKAFNDYAEAEAAMTIANNNLENALKSMNDTQLQSGTGAKSYNDALASVSETMNKVSNSAIKLGFDDEATAQGFSKLFAVTKDTTQSQKDLTLAMDLARNKNIDLGSAVDIVSRMHSGAAKELKNWGINLKEGATYAEIFAAVNEKVGGSAAAAAETAAVKMEALKIQLGNVSENIGGALAPAVSRLLEAVAPVIEKVAKWVEQNPNLAAGIIGATLAISGFLVVLAGIVTIAPAIAIAWGLITGPIGLIVLAILAVIAAGVYLYNHWEEVTAKMKALWDEYGAFLLATPIGAFIYGLVEALKFLWQNKEQILTWMQEKWAWFSEQFNAIVDLIKNKWIEWTSFLSQRWEFFINAIVNAWNAFKGAFQVVMDAVKNTWDNVWNGAKDTIIGVWESIKSTIKAGIDWIDQQIQRVTQAFANAKSMVGGAVSTVSSGVSSAWSSVSSGVSNLFRASGGQVNPQSSYVVGENGPELFTPQGYGSIARTGSFGGQPIIINITGNSFLGRENVAEEIGAGLMDIIKSNIKIA